jgi:hypothetical protein
MDSAPSSHHVILLRNRFVRSRKIDDDNISWGPTAASGLQAGVLLEPRNEQYIVGQEVTPRFFYRNTADRKLDVSFPLSTAGDSEEIIAVDAAGNRIPIERKKGPGLPTGWTAMSLGSGDVHEVRGAPMVLGEIQHGAAATVLRAKPGQTVRLRFVLPNYGAAKGEKPLQTGEVVFSMAPTLP